MSERVPDILPLSPYFREMVWGGRRLQTLFGKALPEKVPIGESFELSAYEGRESRVCAGPLEGLGLSDLVRRYGADLLGSAVVERYGAMHAAAGKAAGCATGSLYSGAPR